MAVFVRIETGVKWPNKMNRPPRFLGELVADEIRPIANYELLDLTRDSQLRPDRIARLEGYPRWSEPGLALVARLVECSGPGFAAEPVGALPLTMALSVGASPAQSVPVEQISLQRALDGYVALMTSRTRRERMIQAAMPRPDATLRDLILECSCLVIGWHRQSGPLPAPLNRVPVRQGTIGAFVALADIPPHPRAKFMLRYGLRDGATAAAARLWFDYIGDQDARGGTQELGESS